MRNLFFPFSPLSSPFFHCYISPLQIKLFEIGNSEYLKFARKIRILTRYHLRCRLTERTILDLKYLKI